MILAASLSQSRTDLLIFVAYLAALVVVGLLAARRRSKSRDYFLAGRTLPWYVIGCSMISANIGGEQLVGMVGASYKNGLVIANWCWLCVPTFTLLIFVFLPYYLKEGFLTMPEFLERRYGLSSRLAFAAITIVIDIVAFLGPTLYIGALALHGFFNVNIYVGILVLALLAGSYSIYGGLLAVAWTDLLQCSVVYLGGLVLGIRSLAAAGGFRAMMTAHPEQYHVIQGPAESVPFLGMLCLIPAVGVWYACTNQFYIQRCLAARSEWDSRMSVVLAGFLLVAMPFFIVLPGLAAAKIISPADLPDANDTYMTMIRLVIPEGLRGLMLASLVAAILGTASALINSTGTIATVDFYERFLKGKPDDRQMVRVGRMTGMAAILLGVAMACYLASRKGLIFAFIQDMYAHVAAPFATLFLVGILWRRPSAKPAILTIAVGLIASIAAQYAITPKFIYRGRPVPEFVFMYRVGVIWVVCMMTLIIASLLSPSRDAAAEAGVPLWKPEYLRLPRGELASRSGWKDFRVWWGLFVLLALGLIAYFR